MATAVASKIIKTVPVCMHYIIRNYELSDCTSFGFIAGGSS